MGQCGCWRRQMVPGLSLSRRIDSLYAFFMSGIGPIIPAYIHFHGIGDAIIIEL